LYTLLLTAARGDLLPNALDWDSRAALCVVLAAAGYPDHPQVGDPILGLNKTQGDTVKIFHAGTTADDDTVITAGGRVLGVTALGESLAIAQQRAYAAVANIRWPGLQYRQDIGYRGLRRA
ncbi:MAG TPA: phosphoribosylglycinamide synthetase C domain-containing protein, partial [Acidithiobacillus sp.]|nr:phosphoribosylglycinamide synthetase C domain-containing protein [Acidithiobacillus sp.]